MTIIRAIQVPLLALSVQLGPGFWFKSEPSQRLGGELDLSLTRISAMHNAIVRICKSLV